MLFGEVRRLGNKVQVAFVMRTASAYCLAIARDGLAIAHHQNKDDALVAG
jgi:hypothetical protein